MPLTILQQSPDSPAAIQLIDELEEHLESFGYPPQSRHGFSVEKLIRDKVAFFLMTVDDVPVGCGGIKLFGNDYGEIKRMYVRPQYQGQGYAKAMLRHLANYASQQGVQLIRLETGIHQLPAIRLYETFGFHRCGPFGEYQEDPVSVYMEMRLADSTAFRRLDVTE